MRQRLIDDRFLAAEAGRVGVGDVLIGDVDQRLLCAQRTRGDVQPEERRGHALRSTRMLVRGVARPRAPYTGDGVVTRRCRNVNVCPASWTLWSSSPAVRA